MLCIGISEKKYTEVVWSHGESEEFVKKVYVSETEGFGRAKPVVRCKDRAKEYITYMKELLIEEESLNK